ncbi:MAG: DNA-methyltransferase, partial [Phycisphaerales bacterium]
APTAKANPLVAATDSSNDSDAPAPFLTLQSPEARCYVGDCRKILPLISEVARSEVDLVFADPPFNWNRDYDRWQADHPGATRAEFEADYDTWHDGMPREDYLGFTFDWIDLCIRALRPTGSLFINIPDDTAAEIVCFLKGHMARKPSHPMHMVNWCIWHYRFGQNRTGAFINSKVHCLYFCRNPQKRIWHPERVLEISDRRSIYFDPRTESKKDGMPAGMRVPMDVWYGQFWGRIQGNNKERRPGHDNQLPEVYLERVVQCASNEGMLVLDPFLGSGTTGVVAHALGRRFIGTEFSAANATSAMERIKKGPIRPLGQNEPVSTAIHAPRRKGPRKKK